MRNQRQLKKHIARTCNCGKKFIITHQKINSDLFAEATYNLTTPLPLYCKSYFCDSCAEVKRKKFIARIGKSIKNQEWRFLTLTTINNYHNTQYNLVQIQQDWNRLINFLRTKYRNVKYIKVLEIGDSGMVHLHVLINKFIPQKLIRKMWFKYCRAYKIEISKVASHKKIKRYMSKYLSKQTDKSKVNEQLYLSHKRRFSFSQNIDSALINEKKFFLISDQLYDTENLYLKLHTLNENPLYSKEEFCLDYLPPPLKHILSEELLTRAQHLQFN